jgi:hypothetical protein
MTRLQTIELRQRRTRKRDFLFAAFVALAVAIGVASVATGGTSAPIAHVDR